MVITPKTRCSKYLKRVLVLQGWIRPEMSWLFIFYSFSSTHCLLILMRILINSRGCWDSERKLSLTSCSWVCAPVRRCKNDEQVGDQTEGRGPDKWQVYWHTDRFRSRLLKLCILFSFSFYSDNRWGPWGQMQTARHPSTPPRMWLPTQKRGHGFK